MRQVLLEHYRVVIEGARTVRLGKTIAEGKQGEWGFTAGRPEMVISPAVATRCVRKEVGI